MQKKSGLKASGGRSAGRSVSGLPVGRSVGRSEGRSVGRSGWKELPRGAFGESRMIWRAIVVIHNREKGGGKGVFLVIKNALFLANIKKTQKFSRLRRAFASGGACGGRAGAPPQILIYQKTHRFLAPYGSRTHILLYIHWRALYSNL